MKTYIFSFMIMLRLAISASAAGEEKETMRIKITAGSKVLTATLLDNATSRDFMALLPLTLTLKDYAGTEKVSDLASPLSTQGAPSGSSSSAGDIALYVPWGNLAIFYRDFVYAAGLITMGKIDSGVDKIPQLDGAVTFKRMLTAE